MRLLLPTFERPANASSMLVGGGSWLGSPAAAANSALTMVGTLKLTSKLVAPVPAFGSSSALLGPAATEHVEQRLELLALEEPRRDQENYREHRGTDESRGKPRDRAAVKRKTQGIQRRDARERGDTGGGGRLEKRASELAEAQARKVPPQTDEEQDHLRGAGSADGDADPDVSQRASEEQRD